MNGDVGLIVDHGVAIMLSGGGASEQKDGLGLAFFEVDVERVFGELVVENGGDLVDSVEELLVGFGVDEKDNVVNPR